MEPLKQFVLSRFALLVCALFFKGWRTSNKKKTCYCTAPQAGGTAPIKHKPASEVESMMKEVYKLWATKGSAKSGAVADMNQWFGNLTLNIAIRMVGGKRFFGTNADVDEESARRVQKVMRELFYLFGVFVLPDALPFLGWLDTDGYVKRMKRTAKELDALIGGWLEEHKQKRLTSTERKKEEEQDFMDVMLNILEVEDAEISSCYDADTITKATCLNLILAGSDTTMGNYMPVKEDH